MISINWDLIVRRIREGVCVPFLGAGASVGFDGPGLPTGSALAEMLAEDCNYPGADRTDLFRVAQYYTMAYDRFELQQAVKKMLSVAGVGPSIVHRILAKLPFSYVLTTNFDDLMEQAFRAVDYQGKKKAPESLTYERRGDAVEPESASIQNPLVYKLHGSLDAFHKGLVVSEDDVIEFLSCLLLNEPPLPKVIKGLFEHQSILFIGYGLRDWNIRVMLRAIRGGRAGRPPDALSFAIQRMPQEPGLAQEWEKTVMYWDKRENLSCYDMDAVGFVRELEQRYYK